MGSLAAAPSPYQPRYGKLPGSAFFSRFQSLYTGRFQEVKNLKSTTVRSLKRKLATSPVITTVRGQTLFRSYGRLFAEFLDEESLVHLGLLDLSTCVGLRYGRLEYIS
jgi:hypothetical protein